MTWMLFNHLLVLKLVLVQHALSQLCDINTNIDYSQRSLSIVSFDNRGPALHEREIRGYGQRFGPGLREIVVLGKNCTWNPLKVCKHACMSVYNYVYILFYYISCHGIFVSPVLN